MAYQKLRDGLQANVAPGGGRAVRTAESRLRELLVSSGMFADVEVDHTADQDRLVVALCRYLPRFRERDVVDLLERAWATDLRDHGWEAHSFLVDERHVELQAATMQVDQSHYVTVHLVAQQAVPAAQPQIPGQRTVEPLPPVAAVAA